jgi:hypothetical protein
MTNGTVTVYPASLLSTLGIGLPGSFSRTFANIFGYAAAAENVGLASKDLAYCWQRIWIQRHRQDGKRGVKGAYSLHCSRVGSLEEW